MGGKIIEYKLPCTAIDKKGNSVSCGSSDAMVRYEDGGLFCHKCQGINNSEKDELPNLSRTNVNTSITNGSLDFYYEAEYKPIDDRKISIETCKKYGVRTTTRGSHLFPGYDKEGKLVAVKERFYPEKRYRIHGDISKARLFGFNQFPPTGRYLTITEGEYDALASFQMSGSKYPNVSVWNGAGSAYRECKEQYEDIMEYDTIVLNFDNDKPGKDAIDKVAPMFAGKTKVLLLTDGKDACEYLKQFKIKQYVDEFFRAKRYTLGGIINGSDTWEKYKEKKDVERIPFDSQYEELNHKTYGIGLGEIILVTAGTGAGKTQVLREWKYHLLRNTNYKIMDISLEESVGDTIGGLMALHANKRIMLPDVNISEEEERRIHKELYDDGRFLLLDHEGSVGDDSLLDKIEYAAVVEGCKIIFLDHITIAVSDCEAGSENVTMDKFMNRLLKMVKRLNICVIVVSHLRKTGNGGKSFEEGRVPTEDDLKGSGALKQIAMTTIAISRNKYAETEEERNTTHFHVLKCRFTGRTGPCESAYFDDDTGRMNVIDPEEFFANASNTQFDNIDI